MRTVEPLWESLSAFPVGPGASVNDPGFYGSQLRLCPGPPLGRPIALQRPSLGSGTPLHVAASEGNVAVAIVLLQRGAPAPGLGAFGYGEPCWRL